MSSGADLSDLRVRRIDYCYNAVLPDKEQECLLAEVQKLLHRNDYMAREKDYETSIYYKSKSRVTQLYDKTDERKRKNQPCEDYEISVLRLESQIKREHIKYRMKKSHKGVSWDDWVNWETHCYYLTRALEKVIYIGDYCTFDTAAERIQQAGLSDTKQNRLLKFLRAIQAEGLDEARKMFHSINTTHTYLQLLNDLKINPILIPDNAHFDVIPNPFLPILSLHNIV